MTDELEEICFATFCNTITLMMQMKILFSDCTYSQFQEEFMKMEDTLSCILLLYNKQLQVQIFFTYLL